MGVLTRATDVLRSHMTALVERFEDPTKMSNQMMYDMQRDIANAEGQLSKLIGQEKLIAKKITHLKDGITHRDQQIRDVIEGDEALARELVEDKQSLETTLTDLEKEHADMLQVINELKPAIEDTRKEFAKFKQRRDTIVAKHQSAKAQKSVYDTLGGLSKAGNRRMSAIDRMEERVETHVAEAQASKEMVTYRKDRSLDARVAEASKTSVDDELAKYKTSTNSVSAE